MRTIAFPLVALCLAAATANAAPPIDTHRAARLLAEKLQERRDQPRPQSLDSSDFTGTDLGCIALRRGEMRGLGYPGHAVTCENATTGEILGAVLNKNGRVICYIAGSYTGDACYDLTICDNADTLCVR